MSVDFIIRSHALSDEALDVAGSLATLDQCHYLLKRATQDDESSVDEAVLAEVGMAWVDRASQRLRSAFSTYLRAGTAPITTEQAAMAYLKTAQADLTTAARALTAAAEGFKYTGNGRMANQTITAARHAREAAERIPI